MGLALIAGVAVAWWIVRSHPGTRGSRILSQIRQEGLDAHWRGFKQRWILRQDPASEKPSGWRCELIVAGDDGWFHGLDVERNDKITWELWKLDKSATEGTYRAGGLLSVQRRLRARDDTKIRMDRGVVTVWQRLDIQFVESQAPAPDNYLPEGMLPLVRRVVAIQKTHAKFKIILNQVLPDPESGQPRFINVDMRCLPQPSKGATDIRISMSYGGRPAEAYKTYAFDEAGTWLGSYDGKHDRPSERTATYPEIRKAFPQAGAYLRTLIDELKFPIPESHKPPPVSRPNRGAGWTPRPPPVIRLP